MVVLTFLGTAGDDFVAAKQDRSSGGLIIKDSGVQIIVNPGPGSLLRTKECQVNIRETSHVFVTTTAFYASYDLGAVLAAMTYQGLDGHGAVFLEESAAADWRRLAVMKCVDKIITMSPGMREFVKNVEFHAVGLSNKTSELGLKFLFPRISLGVVGQTAFNEQIAEKFKGCHVLILSARHPSESPGSVEDALLFAKSVKPKLVLLSGFGIKTLGEYPGSLAKKVQKGSGVLAIAADDGSHYDLDELLFSKNQKHLSEFS